MEPFDYVCAVEYKGVMDYLSDRLRLLRDLTGASARGIARLAGLRPEQHLSILEAGKRRDPRTSTVVRMARVYGVTVDWLATGEGVAFIHAPALNPRARKDRKAAAALVRAAVESARAATANDNDHGDTEAA